MKKWVIVLLGVLGVLLLVLVGAGMVGYFRFYKPLLAANTYVGGAQRLESLIADKSPYEAPASRELTADQVARFVTVEERVADRIGVRIATFRTQYEILNQSAGGPTSRAVRAAMGEIGGVYLQAKETQYRALNTAQFSKAEYEWVRARVYAAGGVPFAHLDLRQILEDPGNLDQIIDIERASVDATAVHPGGQLVEPHLSKLKDWRVLAFFDL